VRSLRIPLAVLLTPRVSWRLSRVNPILRTLFEVPYRVNPLLALTKTAEMHTNIPILVQPDLVVAAEANSSLATITSSTPCTSFLFIPLQQSNFATPLF